MLVLERNTGLSCCHEDLTRNLQFVLDSCLRENFFVYLKFRRVHCTKYGKLFVGEGKIKIISFESVEIMLI